MVASIFPVLQGQIGSLTSSAEAMASVVAAGMVLGGFAAGALGLLTRQSRRPLERRVFAYSYIGGIVGVLLAALDLVKRYGL